MNEKNTEFLIERFPYFDVNSPFSAMSYGFTCGDGWLNLLTETLEKIEKYLKENNIKYFEITQVKEKFGTLRIYFDGGDKNLQDIVLAAEKQSEHICEECGTLENVETRGSRHWIRNLCPKCDAAEDDRILQYRQEMLKRAHKQR